jgi:recombining binding protein suppressor of hairless
MSITPFPTLFQAPIYRVPNHTLDLTVSSFFYNNPKTGHRSPLEIWLGDIGPLPHRVCNAPPTGPLTNIAPFYEPQTHGGGEGSPPPSQPGGFAQAASLAAQNLLPPAPPHPPFMSPGPLHTNILVDLPPIQEIMKALQNDIARNGEGPQPEAPPPTATSANPPPDSATTGATSTEGNGQHNQLNFVGRSLPLLFIRGADGIGYHSGRTIALDNLYVSINQSSPGQPQVQPDWMISAAAAASMDGNLQGWTLKVM